MAKRRRLKAHRGEVKSLELRIGVVGHSLMQAKVRFKSPGKDARTNDGDLEFEIDDEDDDSDNSLYL